MNLQLPLDFERWPEFWRLKEVLMSRRQTSPADGGQVCEGMAILLWLRLWVVLGYLARSTDKPGWLDDMGVRQVNQGMPAWQFQDCSPVEILAQTPLLTPVESSPDGPKGYMCKAFADLNEALAGNFMSKEERGNRRSEPGRTRNSVAAEAKGQMHLLPPATFTKRSGEPMVSTECEAAIRHIRHIDRALVPGHRRPPGSFTPGLMADACAAVGSTNDELRFKFYQWLSVRRDHPATPKSAEEILKDWDSVYAAAKRMDGF
jgi:hypothetical protein